MTFEFKTHQTAITDENEVDCVEKLMRGIPNPGDGELGVSVAFPGIGNNTWTIVQASDFMIDLLLVAGYHEEDVVARDFTAKAINKLTLIEYNNFCIQGVAKNAHEQAEWVANQVETRNLTEGFTLHVSNFHLQRAWRTVLESLRRREIFVPVFPVPVIYNPYEVAFLDNQTGQRTLREVDVIAGEYARIKSYQLQKKDGSPGDVATTEWLLTIYLPWLYKQELVIDLLEER